MKIFVEIPEVHKVIVEVDVPAGSDRETIITAADNEAQDMGDELNTEFSHTLENDVWVIRDENGNYIGDKHFGSGN